MLTVHKIGENLELTFSLLDPKSALVAAFEQDRGNFSTWAYKPASAYPIKEDAQAFRLGSFLVYKGATNRKSFLEREEVAHAQPSLF
jgi:hypothetical protein